MAMDSNYHGKRKQKLDTHIGFEDPCRELVEKIVTYIPLKPRTRMKCVSKIWCGVINHLRHSGSLRSSSALVYMCHNLKHESSNFITFEDQSGVIYAQSSLSLSHSFHEARLVDSCNGLLLYAMKDEEHFTKDEELLRKYVVSNPALNQNLEIPTGKSFFSYGTYVFAAIAYEISQKHFKVICYSLNKFTVHSKVIECRVFSSETREWTTREAIIFNSTRTNIIDKCCHTSLYWKGKLYSIWGKNKSEVMLVYNVEKGFFDLVLLPKMSSKLRSDLDENCLWESDGQLQFCRSGFYGFHIWTYEDLNNDDVDDVFHGDRIANKWFLKLRVEEDKLKLRLRELLFPCCESCEQEAECIRPHLKVIAFDDDLQILYVKTSGFILSYSLETRRLEKLMWSDLSSMKTCTSTMHPRLFNCTGLYNGLLTCTGQE